MRYNGQAVQTDTALAPNVCPTFMVWSTTISVTVSGGQGSVKDSLGADKGKKLDSDPRRTGK